MTSAKSTGQLLPTASEGHAPPSTEQARIWYHFLLCTLPPLHCERFPCWIIATLFAPLSFLSLTHTQFLGGRGTLAKCRDNSQHGSWWEIEHYNGVTNLHSRESFGPLTQVAGKITSLPPEHRLSKMPLKITLRWHAETFFLITEMGRVLIVLKSFI